jgi:predicted dehydrogenase
MNEPRAMDETPLRVAVVGTSFGGRVHVPALQAAGFDVVALVGRDPARTSDRADKLGVAHACTSLADALALGVDAVTVSTPPDTHVDLVLEAVDAGAHVLCEKPFALNAQDGQRMYDAARRRGVVHCTSFEFRWSPLDAAIGRFVTAGGIGDIKLATFLQISSLVAGGLHPAFNEEWWFDATKGGGILNAAAPHNIDRFRTWAGEIDAVSARLDVTGPRADTPDAAEDAYTATFRMRSGATALMQHCAAAWGEPTFAFKLVGTKGTITLGRDTASLGRGPGDNANLPIPDDLQLPDIDIPKGDPKHAFTFMELPPFVRLAQRFADAIRHGDPQWSPSGTPPTPTFADALATQRIIDAMRVSSRENAAWVDVEPMPAELA